MNRCWIPGWQFSERAFEPLWSSLGVRSEPVLTYAGEQVLTREQWVAQQASRINEPTTLVGWSLGGMLAVEIAAINPFIKQVLVLNANVKFAGEFGLATEVANNFSHRYQRNPALTRKRFVSLVDANQADSLSELLLESDEHRGLQWLYEVDLQSLKPTADVHVLLSEHDQLVPSLLAHTACQKTGATVTVVPGEHSLPLVGSSVVAQWMLSHG